MVHGVRSPLDVRSRRAQIEIVAEKPVHWLWMAIGIILIGMILMRVAGVFSSGGDEKAAKEQLQHLASTINKLTEKSQASQSLEYLDIPFLLPDDYVIVAFDKNWDESTQVTESDVVTINGKEYGDETFPRSVKIVGGRMRSHTLGDGDAFFDGGVVLKPRACMNNGCICVYYEEPVVSRGEDKGRRDTNKVDCFQLQGNVVVSGIYSGSITAQNTLSKGAVRQATAQPRFTEGPVATFTDRFTAVPYNYFVSYGNEMESVAGLRVEAYTYSNGSSAITNIVLYHSLSRWYERVQSIVDCPTVPDTDDNAICNGRHSGQQAGDVVCRFDSFAGGCVAQYITTCSDKNTQSDNPYVFSTCECEEGTDPVSEGLCVKPKPSDLEFLPDRAGLSETAKLASWKQHISCRDRDQLSRYVQCNTYCEAFPARGTDDVTSEKTGVTLSMYGETNAFNACSPLGERLCKSSKALCYYGCEVFTFGDTTVCAYGIENDIQVVG